MKLAIFILVVFGWVEIIIKGKPAAPFRKLLSRWKWGKEFVRCPLCLGFWCGAVLGLILMPSYDYVNVKYTAWVFDLVFDGFIGAGTSYFLHTWITPLGFMEDENE